MSAAMVMGIKPTKPLLEQVNHLNVARALSRRIVIEGKVLVVAEMPLRSLRPGDLDSLLSMVLTCVRLDAPLFGGFSGRLVTDPPGGLAPDVDRLVHSWPEALQASHTATVREFTAWLDARAQCDCWIDRDDDSVTVVLGQSAERNVYPFRLVDLRALVGHLHAQAKDADDL